jgi:hypothetical protein
MIPFSKWMEGLSEPQDKVGEKNADLEKVVEKRLMQMIMSLEMDGRGARKDIIQIIKKIVGGVAASQPQAQPQAEVPADQNPAVAG